MTKAHGIDISKYDYPVDLSKATGAIDFVIQRASYGMVRDERFEENWAAIRHVPVLGAYHYFSTAAPWKDQADRFLTIVDGRGYHFYAIDYETAYNNLNAASSAALRAMLEYLAARVSPRKVLFYTSPSIYTSYLRPYGDWMKDWELWIAQYPYTAYLNLDKGPALPAGRTQWTFWQYGGGSIQGTAGYDAGPKYGTGWHGCDLNVFNGTVEQLHAWAGISSVPTPPAPPPPSERAIRLDELRRLEAYLNARKAELG